MAIDFMRCDTCSNHFFTQPTMKNIHGKMFCLVKKNNGIRLVKRYNLMNVSNRKHDIHKPKYFPLDNLLSMFFGWMEVNCQDFSPSIKNKAIIFRKEILNNKERIQREFRVVEEVCQ